MIRAQAVAAPVASIAVTATAIGFVCLLAAGGCRFDPPTDPGYVAPTPTTPPRRQPDAAPPKAQEDAGDPIDPGVDARPASDVAVSPAASSGDGGGQTGGGGATGGGAAGLVGGDGGGGTADAGSDGALSPSSIALPGLVAHWPFDEGAGTTAADVTGNGNKATLLGGAAWSPSGMPGGTRPGNFAITLDGVDDNLAMTVAKLPALPAAKTVAFWLFATPTPATAGGQITCLALLNAGAAAGLQIGTDKGRAAVWQLGQAGGFIVAPAVLTPGFHHWVYTFDGTAHGLYLDGKPIGTKTMAAPSGAVATFLVGTYEVPNEMCAGQIDDLRVYDRALAPGEITQLAQRP